MRTLKSTTLIFSLLALFSSCGKTNPTTLAHTQAAPDSLENILIDVSQEIQAIQRTVMINDEARLQVLNRTVMTSIELAQKNGLANIQTVNGLRKMIMYFIYSEQFLQFIRKDDNSDLVDALLAKTIAMDPNSIRKQIGYDEDPMGTMLADNLDIMQQRITELLAFSELPMPVREGFKPLIARIGYVLGLARGQGDRMIPYLAGIKLCGEVDKIYPLLDQLNGSSQFFVKSQDIRGTNEFLKDFLQVRLVHEGQN